jgi:hypothetical protein
MTTLLSLVVRRLYRIWRTASGVKASDGKARLGSLQ